MVACSIRLPINIGYIQGPNVNTLCVALSTPTQNYLMQCSQQHCHNYTASMKTFSRVIEIANGYSVHKSTRVLRVISGIHEEF